MADAITWLRLIMLPFTWWFALLGQGRIVGVALLLAGLTDFLDGYAARRFGGESRAGAVRDLIADTLLLISAVGWIGLLHPEVVRDNTLLVVVSLSIYAASMAAGLLKFRRLPNLHLYSSKAAGGLLYAFAVITLLRGTYDRLLLALAAAAFIVSCVETLAGQLVCSEVEIPMGSVLLWMRRDETSTIQASGRARRQRSHAPTANIVGSIAKPMSITTIADVPSPKDSGP